MRDVSECYSTDLFRYLGKLSVVELSRICRESCEDDLGLMLMSQSAHLVKIHFAVDGLVSDEIEYLGKEGHRRTMREMSTVRQIHT